MALRFLAVLLLTACFNTVTTSECEDSATPVSDAEVTPGGTAADLIGALGGTGTAEGVVLDERLMGVTWTVERGEGSAEWIESVAVSRTTRAGGLGFSNMHTLALPDCHDRLEVPVLASVSTDDGTVDVSIATVGESRPDLGGVQPNLHGGGPYDEAAFPHVPSVDPDAFDDKQAFVKLFGLGSDGVSGTAGWEGTQITETFNSASAHTILGFPVPEI